jgi:hypothetical protein
MGRVSDLIGNPNWKLLCLKARGLPESYAEACCHSRLKEGLFLNVVI